MTHLILILGMHRSGTSLVTKSMECLGVSLGDNADWSGPDNVSGFWEDRDILAIDNAVLARYGATWDTVDLDLSLPAMTSDIAAIAQRVLASKLDRFRLLAIKDPRMCRLLPFWRPVFERIGCRISVVRPWRLRSDVIRSLTARNCMEQMAAYRLCEAHDDAVSAAIYETGWPYVATSHRSMVTHPATEVRHIGHRLGLGIDEAKLRWFCEEFVRKEVVA